MANKRNKQKQRNSSKTLEGYERYLLQQMKKWHDVSEEGRPPASSEARHKYFYYKRTHEELRNYYFDI